MIVEEGRAGADMEGEAEEGRGRARPCGRWALLVGRASVDMVGGL